MDTVKAPAPGGDDVGFEDRSGLGFVVELFEQAAMLNARPHAGRIDHTRLDVIDDIDIDIGYSFS
jgi:hypothetical protein